jgi:hypothetical protein
MITKEKLLSLSRSLGRQFNNLRDFGALVIAVDSKSGSAGSERRDALDS